MSSSSKKKLRKEQAAAQLTQKQLSAQQEAKKVKQMTILFVVVLALVLVAAITVLSIRAYNNSGIRERNTVALTIGNHDLTADEFNYYYFDSINSFYSQFSGYGSYASAYAQAAYGIDMTKPLDEQTYDEDKGETWADYFIDKAQYSATSSYALYDEALANDFALSDEEQAALEEQFATITTTAKESYGYSSLKAYLKAMYGAGATVEGYKEYYTQNTIANAYATAYQDSITYTDEQYRAYESGKEVEYSSFSYATYYIARSEFLTGGTTDEDGTTTYTDAQYLQAEADAKETADALAEEATSLTSFNKAIAALDINKDSETEVTATVNEDTLYSSVTSYMRDWICDETREKGETTVIENTTDVENDDGTTTQRINGYYVVLFLGSDDNNFLLPNVRHILVDFEGGTTDSSGNTTYTDEEKAATMESAEALLDEWKNGEATEDSFAALANEKSTDPGSNTNGGLYEKVYPGEMLDEFNDWVFATGRKVGDTGVIQTSAGCHIMYYSGESDITFRDFMIRSNLLSEDITQWQTDLVEALVVTPKDMSLLNTSLVMIAS